MNDFVLEIQRIIIAVAMCTPRIMVALAITPIFNPRLITGMTRNAISVSLALILFPTILPLVGDRNLSMLSFAGVIVKESIIGAALGFMMGLFFWGVECIGGVIDYQRGAAIAQSFDPATGSQTSPLKHFLLQVAIALFFTAGGFTLFLSAIYESYRIWPIFSYMPKLDADFARFFLQKTDDLMSMAVLLASPILIAMFLTEFGMGLINRFAPQLNVFFLSMPIKSAVAIFMLILYQQFLLTYLKDYMIEDATVVETLKVIIK